MAHKTNTTIMNKGMYGAPSKPASTLGKRLAFTGFIAALSKLLSIVIEA
jgi:hypothetical protein|tara:strand:- start:1096 stop:1242 length:147 start_codon:yes stop_codon:yes gene_type:complete